MTHAMLTKILINIGILIFILIGSYVLLRKIKFESKGYKYLFITYSFFWMAPMLLRSYAGTFQNLIDINLTWIVLASYGFVGIVIRPFADIINYYFKSRKIFLYIACIIQIITFIPLLIHPSTTTSIIQSIGVGVGASCIGTFQLLFKEQYNESRSFLTVSILSIPPLIANFLTAPIQSVFMILTNNAGNNDLEFLKSMWLVGLVFVLISLIMIFFMKENKNKFDSITNGAKIFNFKNDGLSFVILLFVGLLITFIKFSTSGGVGTLHLQTISKLNNQDCSSYEGYLSVIFSIFQLLGGVLVGLVLVKYLKNIQIFAIGSIVWIIYLISYMFVKNPIGYFILHGLTGFAYGILYNLILGQVLNKRFNTPILSPMGIYQSVLAIGISLSGIFTQFIKNNLIHNYWIANNIISISLISTDIILFIIYFISYYLDHNKIKIPSFKI